MRLDRHRVHPPVSASSNGEKDLNMSECVKAGNSLVSAANVVENSGSIGPFRFGQSTKIGDSDDSYAIANTDSATVPVLRRQWIHGTLLHSGLPRTAALDFWEHFVDCGTVRVRGNGTGLEL